jgi:hypothetical protein
LLRGGLLTIDLNFGPPLASLAANRQAQLAVLPGATHMSVARRSGEVLGLITPFLYKH